MNKRKILAAACAVLAAVQAGGTPRADHGTDLVPLCVKVKPAYVFIAGGSGVVISPDGLMLTNNHVIEGKRTFDVRLGDGSSFKAKLLGTDPYGDLAALRLVTTRRTRTPSASSPTPRSTPATRAVR